MLHSIRNRRTCRGGCCGEVRVPSRTLRTRQRRAWRKDWQV